MKIPKENSMLCDIQYVRKTSSSPDYLYVVWRDLDTNEKKLEVVPEPVMTIYYEKPEYRNHDYVKNYARKEWVTPKVVKYNKLKEEIANEAGGNWKRAYYNCFETKRYRDLDKIQLWPYVFGSDFDIESWYRLQWRLHLENKRIKRVTKGFYDIEVDGIEINVIPEDGSRPINAVTFIDGGTKTCYTFLYLFTPIPEHRDRFNPNPDIANDNERQALYEGMWAQQQDLLDNMDGFIQEIHENFDELYPGFEYKIYTYTDEKKMLVHLFQLINQLKLDIVGSWTIYDMDYIIKRLQCLGMNAVDVICPSDFPTKQVKVVKDTRNFGFKNKLDYCVVTSYTKFVDQAGVYAGIRKAESELRSIKLNYIAKKELKDEKYDYTELGDIKTIAYKNYKMFILYNIKDVLLQYGIEYRVKDFDYIYTMSYLNAVPYHRVFHRIINIRNQSYLSYWKQGLIPGNNKNKFNEEDRYYEEESEDDDDDDDKIAGALVADPAYNDYVGRPLYGHPTNNIFRYVIDEDMTAFYPSINMAGNLHECTLIFKVILPPSEYRLTKEQKKDTQNLYAEYKGITDEFLVIDENDKLVEDISKEVFDNFLTRNYLSFGYKWLNMPDINEVYEYLKRKE